ncbi:MAG: carbohydrate binding domain-containing protein [Armatimonadota bacterium]|nr:carbohydrate binding domain-containing protein [Armatimonadota bacterium]
MSRQLVKWSLPCAAVALSLASLRMAGSHEESVEPQGSSAAAVKMVINNGDFEAATGGLEGWSFWSRTNEGSAEYVTDKHGGQGAARIQHTGPRDWAFTNSTKFDVKPGQIYTATAWAKGSGGIELAVVALSGGKTLAWSIGSDGIGATPEWTKLEAEAHVPKGCDQIYLRFIGNGKADIIVDDVQVRAGGRPRVQKPQISGAAKTRVTEKIGRGVIALPTANNAVYIGWRLLKSDAKDVAFNVYRRSGEGAPLRLNAEPLQKTTDFVDANPPAGVNRYFVSAVVKGQESPASETVTATATAEGRPYLSFKIAEEQTFQKIGIADLDGDGHYDFVIKTPNSNIDPFKDYWKPSPGTFKLLAYRHDGTPLWTYDMGWAIEQGIWYSPYVVYDFDGDGRAEVACKSGAGDPRDPDGRVTKGPEYVSILDGRTGRVIARADWPSREGYPDYNYYSRNQLGVAYLDGKTPCLIVERGTYNTIKLAAYQLRNKKLEPLWTWRDREDGGLYRGQGAHCLRAADVDGDGRDEVIIGSAVIDDNGVGLWSTGMGHPDHVTVGDLDPTRPGMEIQYGMETAQKVNGICMVDAKTGEYLWGLKEPTTHIHSSGLCADLDAAHPGVESYGGERDSPEKRWLFSAKGELLVTKDLGGLAPRAAYWDGDVQRELMAGGRLRDFNGDVTGPAHEPKLEGSVVAIVDCLGDWREEVITTLKGEMRIYSTTIPATDRRVSLIQDPIYRLDVVAAAQGYYQIQGLSVLPSAGSGS